MSRYYFHLHECGDVVRDEEGVELDGVEAARAFAINAARDVITAEVRVGQICLACVIKVHDAAGELVMTVPFRDAVRLVAT